MALLPETEGLSGRNHLWSQGRDDGTPIGKRPMEMKAEEPFFLKLGLAMQRGFSASSSLYVPSAGVRGHGTWSKVISI